MTEEQALERLEQICAGRETCTGDLREKCRTWGLTDEVAERVIAKLVKEKFVDDARFAPLYVRDKARFSGWGPMKIRMQLSAKGIDENMIEDALEAVSKEEWHEILCKVLKTKIRTTHQEDGNKLFASVVRFGMQRGFSYEAIKRAISSLKEIDIE